MLEIKKESLNLENIKQANKQTNKKIKLWTDV